MKTLRWTTAPLVQFLQCPVWIGNSTTVLNNCNGRCNPTIKRGIATYEVHWTEVKLLTFYHWNQSDAFNLNFSTKQRSKFDSQQFSLFWVKSILLHLSLFYVIQKMTYFNLPAAIPIRTHIKYLHLDRLKSKTDSIFPTKFQLFATCATRI